jgi:hypothetical protein
MVSRPRSNLLIDKYSEREAQRRLEAALRGARIVGHKPQSEMKLGKSMGKSKESPVRQRKRKKKT